MENLTVLDAPVANRVRYAGFLLRLVAIIVDSIVMNIISFAVYAICGLSYFQFNQFDASTFDWTPFIRVWILLLGINWLYYALMESSGNQATLGKMAIGIKVTDLNGNRISFARATGRYFAKTISGVILGIGYLMVIWDPKKQALHDKLAKTFVVHKMIM